MGFLNRLFGMNRSPEPARRNGDAVPSKTVEVKRVKGPPSRLREFPLLYLYFDDFEELRAAVQTGDIEMSIPKTMHAAGITIERAFASEEGFTVLYRGNAVALRLPDGTILRRSDEKPIVHWDETLEQAIAACTPESAKQMPGFDDRPRDDDIAARAPAAAKVIAEIRSRMSPTIDAIRIRYGIEYGSPDNSHGKLQLAENAISRPLNWGDSDKAHFTGGLRHVGLTPAGWEKLRPMLSDAEVELIRSERLFIIPAGLLVAMVGRAVITGVWKVASEIGVDLVSTPRFNYCAFEAFLLYQSLCRAHFYTRQGRRQDVLAAWRNDLAWMAARVALGEDGEADRLAPQAASLVDILVAAWERLVGMDRDPASLLLMARVLGKAVLGREHAELGRMLLARVLSDAETDPTGADDLSSYFVLEPQVLGREDYTAGDRQDVTTCESLGSVPRRPAASAQSACEQVTLELFFVARSRRTKKVKEDLGSAGLAYVEKPLTLSSSPSAEQAGVLQANRVHFLWRFGGDPDDLPMVAVVAPGRKLVRSWSWSRISGPAESWVQEVKGCLIMSRWSGRIP